MLIPDKVLHNETQRHVARLSTRNDDHVEDLDILIRGLHDGGLWPLINTLCIAGPSSADSLLDLKGSQDSVLVGTPAFVADQGFTTVALTDYINTQYTPSDYPGLGLACYIRSAPLVGSLMGLVVLTPATAAVRLAQFTSSAFGTTIYTGGVTTMSSSLAGFKGGSRTDANNVVTISRGNTLSSVHAADAQQTLLPVYVGCRNQEGIGAVDDSANQYAFWSNTKSLDATQWAAYRTLIKDYFTRRGTAV